jgi:hypothetical protein
MPVPSSAFVVKTISWYVRVATYIPLVPGIFLLKLQEIVKCERYWYTALPTLSRQGPLTRINS